MRSRATRQGPRGARPFVEQGRDDLFQAVVQARLDLHDRTYVAVIDLIHRHLERGEASRYILMHLQHLLGRALERSQRFDETFAAYEHSNATIPAHFDAEPWGRSIDEMIAFLSPQRFAAVPWASHAPSTRSSCSACPPPDPRSWRPYSTRSAP